MSIKNSIAGIARSRRFAVFSLAGLVAGAALCSPAPAGPALRQPVVLLHGLALSSASMRRITGALRDAGYRVCPIDYPSRQHPIDTLAVRFVLPEIRRCFPNDTVPIHFVSHSMGGILVRKLSTLPGSPRIGRVVMIAPPNQGSEVVDHLHDTWYFDAWGGGAGNELGTDTQSMPAQLGRLGPPAFEFGVIAGTRSLDPLFSEWIAGRDDGKVSVEHTKLEGMKDFIEIRASHTMILWKDETVRQVLAFLKNGAFEHEGPRR